MYAVGRGWITRATFAAVYAPALTVHRRLGPQPGDDDPGPIRLWFEAYEGDFLPHWLRARPSSGIAVCGRGLDGGHGNRR